VLPGVAVEQGEGNRVLLITSSRRVGIGRPDRGGTYQYFDQVAVTAPMTKWSAHVPSRDRIPELLRHALRAVHTGRPGVVHLDVPEDLINGTGEVDERELRDPVELPVARPRPPAGRRRSPPSPTCSTVRNDRCSTRATASTTLVPRPSSSSWPSCSTRR
jgi:hypothetical protein